MGHRRSQHSTMAKKKKWGLGDLSIEKFFKVTPLRSSENHSLREKCLFMPISVIFLPLRMVHISYGEKMESVFFEGRDMRGMILGKRDTQEDLGDQDLM